MWTKAPFCRSLKCGAAARATVKAALEVDGDDRVPLGFRHLVEDGVAQDAGVVDDGVDVAISLHGVGEQRMRAVPGGDVGAVGDGLAAAGADGLHHLFGRPQGAALAALADSQVLTTTRAPSRAASRAISAPTAAAGACHNHTLPLNTPLIRCTSPGPVSERQCIFRTPWRRKTQGGPALS